MSQESIIAERLKLRAEFIPNELDARRTSLHGTLDQRWPYLEWLEDQVIKLRIDSIGGSMSESIKPEIRPPRRPYELEIKIGGRTWDDVLYQLRELATHIPEHGMQCDSVSGSPSSNHSVSVYTDETMTDERYWRELDDYLESIGKGRMNS